MAESCVARIRCGIPDCNWGVDQIRRGMPGSDKGPSPLTPGLVSQLYGLFWDHCVKMHALNPDTTELPGLSEASFFIDLREGGMLTVQLTQNGHTSQNR